MSCSNIAFLFICNKAALKDRLIYNSTSGTLVKGIQKSTGTFKWGLGKAVHANYVAGCQAHGKGQEMKHSPFTFVTSHVNKRIECCFITLPKLKLKHWLSKQCSYWFLRKLKGHMCTLLKTCQPPACLDVAWLYSSPAASLQSHKTMSEKIPTLRHCKKAAFICRFRKKKRNILAKRGTSLQKYI